MNNSPITRNSPSSIIPPVGVATHGRGTSEGCGRGHDSEPGSGRGSGHCRECSGRHSRGRGSEDEAPLIDDTTSLLLNTLM